MRAYRRAKRSLVQAAKPKMLVASKAPSQEEVFAQKAIEADLKRPYRVHVYGHYQGGVQSGWSAGFDTVMAATNYANSIPEGDTSYTLDRAEIHRHGVPISEYRWDDLANVYRWVELEDPWT